MAPGIYATVEFGHILCSAEKKEGWEPDRLVELARCDSSDARERDLLLGMETEKDALRMVKALSYLRELSVNPHKGGDPFD